MLMGCGRSHGHTHHSEPTPEAMAEDFPGSIDGIPPGV